MALLRIRAIVAPRQAQRMTASGCHAAGDPSKARAKVGWKHKTSFDGLVKEMVEADMATIFKERERRDRHA